MSFLNKYKLHGILCDDMGLGKTLQSLCILAGDHYNRNQAYQVNNRNQAYQVNYMVYSVMIWVWGKHYSPFVYWLVIIIIGTRLIK